MRCFKISLTALAFLALLISGCTPPSTTETNEAKTFNIDYEKYTLENGLEVVLHHDKSDPIVSVAILYHVGSNREIPGRTGFAHLFEHMLFQESQHVPKDTFFQNIQNAGGQLNGGTFQDGTVYFEVIPKNALEMVLWMESDRMGFLLSTVNQEAFMNQQDVVQNEKRQRVDNRPYGHTNYVIDKNLYPEDHPYNWQVIGSFEDLQNATLKDIRDFFTKWYGPNNATLVIAGDFEEGQTREWVEKYFGEIKAAEPQEDPKPRHTNLTESKKVYHEDNFAQAPELNMVFPTINQYEKDAYALDVLGSLLADGKKTPLYKSIVEELKLAPAVSAYQDSMEITGAFHLRVRTFPGKNLTEVEKALLEGFARFEQEGFSEDDLKRVKAGIERNFYNGISSVFGKGYQLAMYNEYCGSPDFLGKDLNNMLAVTKEEVIAAYNTYIKGKPYVLTSFVPKGQTDLVAEGSVLFPVVEENIEQAGASEKTEVAIEVEKIPSQIDRTVMPKPGPDPKVNLPKVWHADMSNGMKMLGVESRELPLIEFVIEMKGGMLLDGEKVGVANLLTDLMMEGTANKTPAELEEAIDNLGARIRMSVSREGSSLYVNTLESKFDETLALVEEILLQPRWDATEFDRIKRDAISQIEQSSSRPSTVAGRVFRKLLYGQDHILSNSPMGTAASVETITLDDLKSYYAANYTPKASYVSIVGSISKDKAKEAFQSLAANWTGEDVNVPDLPATPQLDSAKIYFVDMPGAKQSEIRVGYLAVPYTDSDYFALEVMNHPLGGSFNCILNTILREEKGFTYGARSYFSGTAYPGPFTASSAVRSNATFESMQIVKDEIAKFRNGVTEDKLAFTKNALLKSNALAFETLGALRGMLDPIAEYGLPDDYIKQQESIIAGITVDKHRELAQKYLPEAMVYLVVGDAATQLEPLKKLGLGDPILVDKDGNPVNDATQAGR